jgi:Ion channel
VKHSYGIVFALVVLSFLMQAAAPDGDLTRLLIIWLQAATLVFAVRIAQPQRWPVRAASALAALIAVAAPIMWIVDGTITDGVTAIATALLVAFAPLAIAGGLAREVQSTGTVSLPALSGVLSIYLLIGMFFSFVYSAVNEIGDGSFFAETADPDRGDFLYYSFTTLTTTGFGDFTAASELGRTLSVVEALTGQIYLVTIVALIVSNLRPRRRIEASAPAGDKPS